jgi:transcriptional regulator with XRE-family HTH domain
MQRIVGSAGGSRHFRLRHAKGLSQEDLAYEADVNRSYMSTLERGASYPGLEIIGRLAAVLSVEPDELIRSRLDELSDVNNWAPAFGRSICALSSFEGHLL